MLFTRTSCLFALTTSVVAAPYHKRFEGARRHWSVPFGEWGHGKHEQGGDSLISNLEGFGESLVKLAMRFADGRWGDEHSTDVSKSQLPQYAQEYLPPPSEGLTLYKIAVGRGTQNYTCDLSNSTAVPVAAGAVASLYDFTDTATCSTLGAYLPRIALNDMSYPISATSEDNNSRFIGHHYFSDATTAYFNLDSTHHTYGQGGFGKTDSYAAPSNASTGPANAKDQNYGAVPWLKLLSKDASQCVFQEVYRVNTAGGQPPATCDVYKASSLYTDDSSSTLSQFQIQYSAEYWFYATSEADQ